MAFEARLREYVDHVTEGGDPDMPDRPLSNNEREVWVSWRTDDGTTRLEIRVDGERYGPFVDGRRIDSSWEGGVDGPDVAEWEAVRRFEPFSRLSGVEVSTGSGAIGRPIAGSDGRCPPSTVGERTALSTRERMSGRRNGPTGLSTLSSGSRRSPLNALVP
jgi:hypothetical protein